MVIYYRVIKGPKCAKAESRIEARPNAIVKQEYPKAIIEFGACLGWEGITSLFYHSWRAISHARDL